MLSVIWVGRYLVGALCVQCALCSVLFLPFSAVPARAALEPSRKETQLATGGEAKGGEGNSHQGRFRLVWLGWGGALWLLISLDS